MINLLINRRIFSLILGFILLAFSVSSFAYTSAKKLYVDCTSASKVFDMSEKQIRQQPVEVIVQARECVEYLQGMHGGVSFNNLAIVMQNQNVSAKTLAQQTSGVCLPSTTNREMVNVVLKFMENNKDKLDMPRELIVGHAFRAAYPPEKYCTAAYYQHLRDSNK
ncbi:MAG: Rap1a/Tai family immunity protein [Gammaproteobacteria bacterium]